MGLFDFFEPQKPRRRRRSPQGPIECLPAASSAKPLPSFNKPGNSPPIANPTDTADCDSRSGLNLDDTAEFDHAAATAPTKPRFFHHHLIHEALRELTFAKPAGVFRALTSNDGPRFFERLLERLAGKSASAEERPDFTAADIRLHKIHAGRRPCVIVEMPLPQFATEAYYAALMLTADSRTPLDQISAGDLRFFTLERTFSNGTTPQTVIGEWTAEGVHRSFGAGPPPQLEKFIYTLSGMAQ